MATDAELIVMLRRQADLRRYEAKAIEHRLNTDPVAQPQFRAARAYITNDLAEARSAAVLLAETADRLTALTGAT